MLGHVFPPFLECCGDAVVTAKRNAVLDDVDDAVARKIVCYADEVAFGGFEMRLCWMIFESFCVFFQFHV